MVVQVWILARVDRIDPSLDLDQDVSLASAGEQRGKDQDQLGPDPIGT